jgi:pyrimidine operon attenuation protein / uracil phosphoribosyltransferase
MEKRYILTREIAEKKLKRMALEIVEQNMNESQLFLLGVKTNGLVIAKKIASYLKDIFVGEVSVIELKIDKKNPSVVSIGSEMDFTGKVILLVDDVANSGRTMLYALKPFLNTYPKKIQTVALVERTYKYFPIDVDYVGVSISTTFDEHITVEVEGNDVTGAWIKE